MSTRSPDRRDRIARITGLYSALIAGWLLSLLRPWSAMEGVESMNCAVLLTVVLGSAVVVFTASRARRLARASARVLWVLGAVMFSRDLIRAANTASWQAGPGLVVSYVVILSLWASVITTGTLVPWSATRYAPAAD